MKQFNLSLEDLLPHRDRMLLVDEILEVDDKMAITRATVSDQWPLFDGQAVGPLVLIELVAQTAGVSNGWVRIQQRGRDSEKKGWLVGIKQARFFVDALFLNQRIITRAENHFAYENFRHIQGTARIGPDVVGEVELQVIQTDSKGG